MKIAVPTRGGVVDNHFGHCDHYTIFTVNDGEVKMKEILPSPQGCGCKSGVVFVLRQKGVQVMLAGNIGEGAKNVLESNEIKVRREQICSSASAPFSMLMVMIRHNCSIL